MATLRRPFPVMGRAREHALIQQFLRASNAADFLSFANSGSYIPGWDSSEERCHGSLGVHIDDSIYRFDNQLCIGL